jgi:hypothetical protein
VTNRARFFEDLVHLQAYATKLGTYHVMNQTIEHGRYGDARRVDHVVWSASLRLALVFSLVAALAAVALASVAEVSAPALVLAVVAIGFATSWRQTGRRMN